MYRSVIGLVLACITAAASAHQFTPTYPVFDSSYIEGVMQTKLELFNKRKEVGYYELAVYDKDWQPVTFASEDKLLQVRYLETKKINVYVKQQDLSKAVYICTESRLRKEEVSHTVVSSKICSKVKQ